MRGVVVGIYEYLSRIEGSMAQFIVLIFGYVVCGLVIETGNEM
ncbi:hypothetical protein KS4_29430 [Poriferisphaera corsica]|uniref:Uncharacterized protein n=1 Tax=Poriferisphaera corsica TaxID=2528020 RepID=A0A517YXC4_9BACT|nr:hypothetical protein KS4_29430 [Poriferisphaera corsica]